MDDPQLDVVRVAAHPMAVEALTENIDPELKALLVPSPIAVKTEPLW
jgi:hypothetical protein